MDHTSVIEFAAATSSDVVGGVSQNTLNRYATKHFQLYPDIYKGNGESAPIDLKWSYQISKAISFSLAPAMAGDDLKRRVLADPFLRYAKALYRAELNAPTVTVTLPDTPVHFTTVAGADLGSVTVSGTLTTAIVVNPAPPGAYRLVVTKVDVHIKSRSLKADALANGCNTNQLIEHILDAVLKAQLQRFVEALPLPQPHYAIDGINVQLTDVSVVDSTLLLALSAGAAKLAQLQLATSTLHGETLERAVFGKTLKREMSEPAQGKMSAKLTLAGATRSIDGGDSTYKQLDAGTLPPGDLFLAFSNTVFQLVANKYLNIAVEQSHNSGGWAYYEYKFGYRVNSPQTQIINSGVQVKAQLEGYAEGSAGLSGCSSAIKVSISADARAIPGAQINAQLLSKNAGKELWLHPFDFPFVIGVDVEISPDVFVLHFLLSLVASALLSLFSAVILPLISLALEIKLVTLPAQVPGTPVPATPTVHSVGNWGGLLFIGIDVGL